MNWWLLLIPVHMACAVLCFGMLLAHDQKRWPQMRSREDVGWAAGMACFASLIGVLGLLIIYCVTGFAKYGLQFKAEDAE